MVDNFHSMEESLKEFLSDEQSDGYNSKSANFYKYNNLKLYIDPHKCNIPHFIIRIGISEAVYNASSGEKISGGLGPDERFIRHWIEKNLYKIDMTAAWKDANKVIEVKITPEMME